MGCGRAGEFRSHALRLATPALQTLSIDNQLISRWCAIRDDPVMVEAFDKFIELRSRKWLGEERVRSQFVNEFDIGNELEVVRIMTRSRS